MENTLEINIDESWNQGLGSWNHPNIPKVITPKNEEDFSQLKVIGQVLKGQLAFMKYPEFQTYANLENILKEVPDNPERASIAVSKHEIGHRFCPYDTITALVLNHSAKKELDKVPYDKESAAKLITNLFTDMCINTALVKRGDKDIPWLYQELSKKEDKKDDSLWNVYATSMELAWKQEILPKDRTLKEEELEAAQELASLFEKDFFDRSKWKDNIKQYTGIISKFLKDKEKDKKSQLDDVTENIPKEIDENTATELAKRLAQIGSNGLPTNPQGLKEFKEIMAGYGQGNAVKASIQFYDMLSNSYNVMFATKPFGRPRINPSQPIKWNPSMPAEKLDVNYSVSSGGRIIPGVNTYGWNTRKRESKCGKEEVVPNLDLYLDSSSSMSNPVEEISLPVLSGFVVAKKAHKKGAILRSTNFSGDGQYETQEWTRDLYKIYENLVTYYNGGTVFPVKKLLEDGDPKQVLVITDSFVANRDECADSIIELRKRNKGNKIAVYALHPAQDSGYLKQAGAEIIHGTNTDIFKELIGKVSEVYSL